MPILQAKPLTKLVAQILEAAGARTDYADIVATHLVNANLAGHDSHGVIRTPHYVRSIDDGNLQPTADPEIVDESACMAQICGNWTFGQVIAKQATELAIEKAARRRSRLGVDVPRGTYRTAGHLCRDGRGSGHGIDDLGWRHWRAAFDCGAT